MLYSQMSSNTLRILPKIYRLLLVVVSLLMFLIVGAGSHGGIDPRNNQTLFAFFAMASFLSTAVAATFFLWSPTWKLKSIQTITFIFFSAISSVFAFVVLIKLLSMDLDESSGWPFISVISMGAIFIIGTSIIYKLLKSP
jgi:hypothetical protein